MVAGAFDFQCARRLEQIWGNVLTNATKNKEIIIHERFRQKLCTQVTMSVITWGVEGGAVRIAKDWESALKVDSGREREREKSPVAVTCVAPTSVLRLAFRSDELGSRKPTELGSIPTPANHPPTPQPQDLLQI